MEQRKREEEELEVQRQREYEEFITRRKMEDEKRQAKFQQAEEERVRLQKEEDDKREQERFDTERSLQEKIEAELEILEDEMERKVEEGKRVLMELDEKRKVCEDSLVGGMSAKGNRLSMPRSMRLLIRRLSFRRLHLGVERRRRGANRRIYRIRL
jgi:hypothetical protein